MLLEPRGSSLVLLGGSQCQGGIAEGSQGGIAGALIPRAAWGPGWECRRAAWGGPSPRVVLQRL